MHMMFSVHRLIIALGLMAHSAHGQWVGDGISGPTQGKCLYQSHFDYGTYIIDKPGVYRLCDNISFKPNPPFEGQNPSEAFQPDYRYYNMKHYGLGFFAAISIITDNVDIYLNGHTLEQSPEHALIQRFYAHIELGSSPFIEDKGPADFGEYVTANNVRILGPGKLGRASHHGVHGNDNTNVVIRDMTIEDFEVAAVSLNNVDRLLIENIDIPKNRRDVPVVGLFSAAHFIGPYGRWLRDYYPNRTITLAGVPKTSVELYDNLMASINKVYDQVIYGSGGGTRNIINGGSGIDELYNNPFGVVDGPCYAFSVHGRGPAVDGFGEVFNETDEDETSSHVTIRNNNIRNIKCWTKEIPGAVVNETVQTDARGSVFQLTDTFTNKGMSMYEDGTYKSNVVADMQIFVAQAIHDGTLPSNDPVLQTETNTISESMVEWATTGKPYSPYYRCNGDSMHHVGKGVVVIRVEDTKGFSISNNEIVHFENLSLLPHTGCDDYHKMASAENPGEQQMGNVRGISVASFRPYSGSEMNLIEGNYITDADSLYPYYIIGIDVQGDSEGLIIRANTVDIVPGTGPHNPKRHVGVRVRENVDRGTILIKSNSLDEGVVFPKGEGDTYKMQMQSGGCPFTKARVFSPVNNPHIPSEE